MGKQIKAGIILQYFQMGLSIIINLVYTPVMIKILGDAEYGIYSLVSSIIIYLNLLSLGFGSSYMRFYSLAKKSDDEKDLSRLNSLYLIVFTLMGITALISGIFIAYNVKLFFNDSYTIENLEVARKLMILLSINLFVSFPSSVFVSYVTSQEKFIFQKLLNIFKTVLSPILSIVLLFNGYGSIGMVFVTTFVSIIIDIINIVFCLNTLKMKFLFKGIKYNLLKEIFSFSLFIAINQIIDQVNWQTDKIVLGKIVNASAVALYSVAANINNMYINFSTAISSVFTPKIHSIVNSSADTENEKNEKLTLLFTTVGRVQFIVVMLILTGFIFFGQFFIIKWVGHEYSNAYFVCLLLICPVTISLFQNMAIEIRRAKNKHRVVSLIMLATAVLNVIISIPFVKMWSYYGAAFGTTISTIINSLIINVYMHKVLHINILYFWNNILRLSVGLIVPILGGVFIYNHWEISSIYIYVLQISTYSIIYAISIYLFGLNKEEKLKVNKIFRIRRTL